MLAQGLALVFWGLKRYCSLNFGAVNLEQELWSRKFGAVSLARELWGRTFGAVSLELYGDVSSEL